MNTMKKWLVAGLIGLSSVGVSWATPDLDLNVAEWAGNDAGGGYNVNFSVSYPGTTTFTDTSLSDPATTAYASRGANSGGNRTGTVQIDDSAVSFSYVRSSGGTSTAGTMSFALNYNFAADQITPLNYSGIIIDFASALPSQLLLPDPTTDYTLAVQYWRTDINEGAGGLEWGYYVLMSEHGAGPLTLNWTDPIAWDGYTGGLSVSTITYFKSINIVFNIAGSTEQGTFTETFNSIKLDGIETQGVPEPETVWMMLAVLGSLAVTFRGQLSDLARRFVKS